MNKDKVVLFVEDKDPVRLALRDYLDEKGYKVLVTSDGVGAIRLLLDNPEIAVIISDHKIDIIGGSYWIRFLEKYCPDKDIIITSGHTLPEYPIPFTVFQKPYDYGEIESSLKTVFEELK